MTPTEALFKAVELAGGPSECARKLNAVLEAMGRKQQVKQQHVSGWMHRGRRVVPPEYAIPMETVVGGQVTRRDFCPDVYPIEPVVSVCSPAHTATAAR